MRVILRALFPLAFLLATQLAHSSGTPKHPDDEHYISQGFFDIHVCNWPDNPRFILALFSTTHFGDVESVELIQPNGKPFGKLDLLKFMVIKDHVPEKRVFIKHFDIPAGASDGWYSARIKMKDGNEYLGRDYVILTTMSRPENLVPANGSENISPPQELRWDPVPGAAYYEVFLEDLWEGKVIYTSPFVQKPQIVLPKGLIQPGGDYSWRVHARDVNGHILLGDFNDGSLSEKAEFSVADE